MFTRCARRTRGSSWRRSSALVAALLSVACTGGVFASGAVASGAHERGHHSHKGLGHHKVVAAAAGVVASAPTGNTFTVESRRGSTQTVTVSSSTIYLERGVATPTLGSVGAGDLVAVFGTISGSNVAASEIVIRAANPAANSKHAVAKGVVQGTPSASSFTILTRHGRTKTVDLSSSTQYLENGVANPTAANIAAGDFVMVFGTRSGTTVTATRVAILAVPSSVTVGTVQTTPSAGSFVIETSDQIQFTVNTSSTTTFSERANVNASLATVQIGENVAVFGAVSGSTITATEIAIGTVGLGCSPLYMHPDAVVPDCCGGADGGLQCR